MNVSTNQNQEITVRLEVRDGDSLTSTNTSEQVISGGVPLALLETVDNGSTLRIDSRSSKSFATDPTLEHNLVITVTKDTVLQGTITKAFATSSTDAAGSDTFGSLVVTSSGTFENLSLSFNEYGTYDLNISLTVRDTDSLSSTVVNESVTIIRNPVFRFNGDNSPLTVNGISNLALQSGSSFTYGGQVYQADGVTTQAPEAGLTLRLQLEDNDGIVFSSFIFDYSSTIDFTTDTPTTSTLSDYTYRDEITTTQVSWANLVTAITSGSVNSSGLFSLVIDKEIFAKTTGLITHPFSLSVGGEALTLRFNVSVGTTSYNRTSTKRAKLVSTSSAFNQLQNVVVDHETDTAFATDLVGNRVVMIDLDSGKVETIAGADPVTNTSGLTSGLVSGTYSGADIRFGNLEAIDILTTLPRQNGYKPILVRDRTYGKYVIGTRILPTSNQELNNWQWELTVNGTPQTNVICGEYRNGSFYNGRPLLVGNSFTTGTNTLQLLSWSETFYVASVIFENIAAGPNYTGMYNGVNGTIYVIDDSGNLIVSEFSADTPGGSIPDEAVSSNWTTTIHNLGLTNTYGLSSSGGQNGFSLLYTSTLDGIYSISYDGAAWQTSLFYSFPSTGTTNNRVFGQHFRDDNNSIYFVANGAGLSADLQSLDIDSPTVINDIVGTQSNEYKDDLIV